MNIDIAALKRVRLWAEHGLKSDLSDLVVAVSYIDALEAEVARLHKQQAERRARLKEWRMIKEGYL